MKIVMSVVVALALLAGCQSTSSADRAKPYFASDIQVIEQEQLKDYWTDRNQGKKFTVEGLQLPVAVKNGKELKAVISYRYLIDSNGKVFNPEILSLEGDKALEALVYHFLNNVDYVAADANPNRLPVQVIVTARSFELGHG